MKQAEEAAAKAKSQCRRTFWLEKKRRVVEAQFFQRFTQQRVLVRINGVEPGEHHRLQLFEARQRLEGGIPIVGDGVADLGVGNILDVGNEEPDFAGAQFVDFDRLGREHTEVLHVESAAIRHQADLLPLADRALDDTREHDDSAIGIEPRIEDERLQPMTCLPLRRWNLLYDGFENLRHAEAGFGADRQRVRSIESDGAFDHFLGALDVGAGQVDLVDDRNDLESIVDGDVGVGQRLRFHTLRCIDHQQSSFARRQRARDFVAEVHVAGRVDKV